MIYLDHNATTPAAPQVVAAITSCMRDDWGNPSSLHAAGRRAGEALNRARQEVAAFIGATPDGVIFTSGGTESCNGAIRTALQAIPGRRHLVASALEHPAVREAVAASAKAGWPSSPVKPCPTGSVTVADVQRALRPDTALVAVMLANNETGVINDVAGICRIARAAGALSLVDATQALGKVPVDVGAIGCDFLAASAHKLHGPRGCGLLWARPGLQMAPLMLGGTQEAGRRPGTENVPGIVGFATACRLCRDGRHQQAIHEVQGMRDRLEQGILALFGQEAMVIGRGAPRLWNTSCVCFRGTPARQMQEFLDSRGIAVGTGSACSCLKDPKPSPTLEAMNVPPEWSSGALRFSFGRYQAPSLGGDPSMVDTVLRALGEWRNATRRPLPANANRFALITPGF